MSHVTVCVSINFKTYANPWWATQTAVRNTKAFLCVFVTLPRATRSQVLPPCRTLEALFTCGGEALHTLFCVHSLYVCLLEHWTLIGARSSASPLWRQLSPTRCNSSRLKGTGWTSRDKQHGFWSSEEAWCRMLNKLQDRLQATEEPVVMCLRGIRLLK